MPTTIMIGIDNRIASGTDQWMMACRVRSEPVGQVGNVDFQRVAEEVLPRFIHDLVAEAEQALQRHRAESADHEERAMREVHDTERAEDERQPESDQGVGAALVQTVQNLKDNGFHGSPPRG